MILKDIKYTTTLACLYKYISLYHITHLANKKAKSLAKHKKKISQNKAQ